MHELYLNNITELAHELTYQRYLLNQGQANTLFQELSIPEYIADKNADRSDIPLSLYSSQK